ncbi:MAG TPA: gluconate 2-dehydrogenase subunit 3 family protein [Acidobacteriota bacterium]|jgi:hypothetical protein
MKRKLTRRRFLKSGLTGSLAIRAVAATAISATGLSETQQRASPAATVRRHEDKLLQAITDEIIPAGDGMPAASEVGSVEYLEKLAQTLPDLKRALGEGLKTLQEVCRRSFSGDFLNLSKAKRVEALKEWEKKGAEGFFPTLRDYIYEAYYTQPQVWRLIGYDFYPAKGQRPAMKAFDAAALKEVRKRPKFYREAG